MKYPVYPEMKNSGIEWLGEIPEHWELTSLRYLTKKIQDGTHGSYKRINEGIPLLSAKNIKNGSVFVSESESLISYDDYREIMNNINIKKGDILLTIVGTIGRVAIYNLEDDVAFQRSVCIIKSKEHLQFKYLFYYMQSSFYQDQLVSKSKTSAQSGVYLEDVSSSLIIFPAFIEQKAIASFLDKETDRIDQLIDKKEHLIKLLQEKRQALISNVVTKGLDPDVPMKDSGIEWLEEIPEEWRISKIKYITARKNGAIKTGPFGSHLTASDMTGSEIKVYNQQNVLEKNLKAGDNYISKAKYQELKSFTIYVGDLLVTTRGTIGKTCIVPKGAEKGVLHPCLMRIQADNSKILNKYLEILIEDSGFLKEQLNLESNATTIEVIYSETMKNVRIPLPPLNEQQQIAEYMDKETSKIDNLIEKVTQQISNLKEYRQALISNAVTGKIDVREVYQDE